METTGQPAAHARPQPSDDSAVAPGASAITKRWIRAKGTKGDGSAVTFTTSFTATACSNSGGAGSGSSGNLPFTGANTAAEGAAGLGLLGVGALAVVAGRRRRTSVK